MFHNVCRLCLGTEDLIWIFNEKMADNMPEIIKVTSGVEISKNDNITQMVCSTCCQITIKMFKFRTTSVKNDKELKARCLDFTVTQLRNVAALKKEVASPAAPVNPVISSIISVPTAAVSVNTGEGSSKIIPSPAVSSNAGEGTSKVIPTPAVSAKISEGSSKTIPCTSAPTVPQLPVVKPRFPHKFKNAHPSLKRIAREYPNIKLPEVSMSSHFGAYITLLTEEVDEWYKEQNYTDEDILKIKKEALDYANGWENVVIPEKQKRRKSSVESRSSTSSKRSSSDISSVTSSSNKKKKV